jgi:uncharacterized protein
VCYNLTNNFKPVENCSQLSATHNPFRINVGFLYNQARGAFRDFPFDLPGLDLAEDVKSGRLSGNIRISRTSEGLLLHGEFTTHIPATCVRCLEDYQQSLTVDFADLYAFPKPRSYEETPEDEPEFVLPDDGYIDVGPLLKEYLLLEIPIKPLHDPQCKGLCPVCGINWNHAACEHQNAGEISEN